MIPKPTKIRSKKITQSAKGELCTFRNPAICNHNPETTVFCHLPGNKGMGTKNHDIFGIYACSSCHDFIDGRYKLPFTIDNYPALLRALQETQLKLVEKGIITVK